jgi:glycosyltransferase involved in cell wall biosynthesis
MLATEKLKVLVFSPIEPFPPAGGWQTVIYNDIKFLASRGHRMIVLATTSNPDADVSDISDIAEAEYFYKHKSPKWVQVLRNVGNDLPYTVTRHYNEQLLVKAKEWIRNGKVDVLLVEDVVMGIYAKLLKSALDVTAYLRGHNISTLVCKRYYESQINPVMKYFGWRQYKKWVKYESSVLEVFDSISQISPIDAEQAEKLNASVKSQILFSGVDLDYFLPRPAEEREHNTIMHVGSLDATTKLPAMIWFYRNVLPKIRESFPKARLELVGYTPKCILHQAGPAEVIVHGRVHDVRPYLAKGSVFIAPQFVGSGIRVKILNAMAMGNAVVATSVACEGLPVKHEHNIFIANSEEQFADAVCLLLGDRKLRERMGQNARCLIEDQFGWNKIAGQLETHLHETVRRYRYKCRNV